MKLRTKESYSLSMTMRSINTISSSFAFAVLILLLLMLGQCHPFVACSHSPLPVARQKSMSHPVIFSSSASVENSTSSSKMITTTEKKGKTNGYQASPIIISIPDEEENFDNEPSLTIQFPITIVALCWFVTFLSALDRVAMSVAILPLAQEFGFSETIKGQISALFSVGYGIAIVPIGIGLSAWSPRVVMAMGILLWSLATLATPLAATWTLSALLCARAAVGAAESVVLPALQQLLITWIPASLKSSALALIFSGFASGTVAAYLASPYVMEWTGGWRGLFEVYGTMGLLLLGPWLLLAQDAPQGMYISKAVSQESPITSASVFSTWKSALQSVQAAPIKDMLSSRGVQGILIAHAANNWGLYNNLSWSPTFYAEQYGLNVRDSAFLSILPSVAGAVGGIFAGTVSDAWIRQSDASDEAITRIRKIFQGIGLYGPAICLLILAQHIPEQPWVAQSLLMGAVGFQACNAAGYGPATQEKAGTTWSGLLYSLTSLPGVILGSLGVYTTGQILDYTHQDWGVVYNVNALVDVVGATGFVALYNSTKEFD
jgi:ACS family sodium-dependent inorganic phosphate cotransporter